MKMTIALLIAISSAYAPVFAQSRKTQKIGLEDGKIVKAQVISRRLNPEKDLTFAGFTIEKSELSEIKKKFGDVKTIKTGDTGNVTASICYIDSNENVVRFSSGETGRGKVLTSVEVFKDSEHDGADCEASLELPKVISNKRDIRLGISKKSIENILGKVSYSINKNDFGYTYSTIFKAPKEMNCSDEAIGISTYQFRLKKSKVVYFKVAQVTSCWTPVASN